MARKQGDVEEPEASLIAFRWFDRFIHTDVSTLRAKELVGWAKWVAQKSHLQRFRCVRATWCVLGNGQTHFPKQTDAAIAADEYDGSVPISQWIAQGYKRRKVWQRGRAATSLVMAVCVAFVSIGLVKYGLQLLPGMLGNHIRQYATAPSERRHVELPDGSNITLGARTEISVHYTARRRVIFMERGEGWFNVAHDSQRPFEVFAGERIIRAIGTQFDVRRDRDPKLDRVTVTVDSGTVEVAPPPREAIVVRDKETSSPSSSRRPKAIPARLVKGQELTYEAGGRQGSVTTADLSAVSAWKEGRLEYRQKPLRDVIVQVNRYSAKSIQIADDTAGELLFSGTVFEGQVREWLRALETAYPIDVSEAPDRIIIRSRAVSSFEPAAAK
jgi:transmembrane sensor